MAGKVRTHPALHTGTALLRAPEAVVGRVRVARFGLVEAATARKSRRSALAVV